MNDCRLHPVPRTPDEGWGEGSVVYRGSSAGREESSAEFAGAVFATTDRAVAEQWGEVRAWRVTKAPRLLDLDDWHGPAKAFVSRLTGERAAAMSRREYDEAAADVFVQGLGLGRLRGLGYDGMRLGSDAALVGRLSDHAELHVEKTGDGPLYLTEGDLVEKYSDDQALRRRVTSSRLTPDEQSRDRHDGATGRADVDRAGGKLRPGAGVPDRGHLHAAQAAAGDALALLDGEADLLEGNGAG